MDYIQLTNGGFYSFSALQVDRVLHSKKTVRVVAASSITDSSNRVAVKEYTKLNAQILNEIVVMRTCHHVNIMSMEKAVFSARDNSISIIMPLCSRGTLTSRIQSGMDRETITSYFIQVACALRYLHRLRYIHGDVKPANILIDDSDKAVLTDFDHSSLLPPHQHTVNNWGGSLGYVAPEATSQHSFCPFKVRNYMHYDLCLFSRFGTK